MIVPLAIVAGGSCAQLDTAAVDGVVSALAETSSRGGRLFIPGVGGGRPMLPTQSTISARSPDWKPMRPH